MNPIVLQAQAHGTGSEQALLLPALEAVAGYRKPETASIWPSRTSKPTFVTTTIASVPRA